MFTATLIARPSRLDAHHVNAMARDLGDGMVAWLSDAEAAEFRLDSLPDDRWSLWEELQRDGVDLIFQRAGARKKAMLLADMDSTMIQQECIDELADVAGVGAHVAGVTARAMNGELDFEAALIERVTLLRGLPESVISRVLADRITLMPGGPELLATMRAYGAHAVLVSGGFTAFTGAIAARLGFDEHHANTLLVAGGLLTGDVARPILGRQAKVDALDRITHRLHLTPADVIAVGDGANDLGMLGAAGTGVALHAKPAVQAQCDIRVNHGDLTALLFIQGYARAEFAV
jgi:phosphoserine phosphatase